MRFPVDASTRLIFRVNPELRRGAVALLAGCALATGTLAAQAGPANGPAADYPVVLGAPFTIDGTTYTPVDKLNYDAVGYAVAGAEGAGGITLAHRTLPLPSYVEVTSLKTGKTILVRAERRGPMSGTALVELSPGAVAQLGLAGEREPVRVRRVNPPEAERALLRAGQRAPERMDTPMSLVGVLLRKLDPALAPAVPVPAGPVTPAPAKPETAKPETAKPEPASKPVSAAKPAEAPKPAPPPKSPPAAKAPPGVNTRPAPAAGRFVVQVGAFSTAANAARAARQVGGSVSVSGKFHRVRITGLASQSEAGAALAKARAAGYSDARIQRAD